VFTGLITDMGEIISVARGHGGAKLLLRSAKVAATANIGDSICVSGACLTVVKKDRDELSFDISDETIKSANLAGLGRGDFVNLEPSLRPDSRIGGHFVTGHVDAVGRVRSRTGVGEMLKFEIEAPASVMVFLVGKGSVAVDGISLTVVDIFKDSFTLIIIPHTAKLTTLGFKGPGDTVNIEVDILGKYVAKFLNKEEDRDSRLMKTLMEGGYA
jgi:riboflavin synthase